MLKTAHLSTFLLVVICVVMGTIVAIEATNPPQLDRPQVITPPKSELLDNSEPPSAGNFALPPLEAYSEITERPLFMSTRRPPEEPKVVEQKQPNEDTSFTLLGVAVTPERTVALLQIDKAGKVARISIGEQINGWQLEAVRTNGVTLRRNETIKDIPLVRKSKLVPPKAVLQAARREKNRDNKGMAVTEQEQAQAEEED